MGDDTENISSFTGYEFMRLVGRAKDKNKNKNMQAESDQCKINIDKDI